MHALYLAGGSGPTFSMPHRAFHAFISALTLAHSTCASAAVMSFGSTGNGEGGSCFNVRLSTRQPQPRRRHRLVEVTHRSAPARGHGLHTSGIHAQRLLHRPEFRHTHQDQPVTTAQPLHACLPARTALSNLCPRRLSDSGRSVRVGEGFGEAGEEQIQPSVEFGGTVVGGEDPCQGT